MKATVLAVCSIALAGAAFAQEMHQHEAHVHGEGALDIAVEGNTILVELRAPGADIVGFEHAAVEVEDRAAVSLALNLLSNPSDLFQPDPAADCSFVSAEAQLLGDGDEDEAHEGEAGGHSEFHAEYVLSCERIDRLGYVEVKYFEAFERAEALEVQAISDKGSFGAELTREAPDLKLEGRI